MKTDTGSTRLAPLTDAVSTHRFVADMTPEYIEKMIEVAMFKHFEAQEIIFKEGEPANRFYLICQGRIALETTTDLGEATPIQTLGANDVLGWSWLFPPYHWHFSARALEPTKAVFFYGTRLRKQCEDDPGFGYELIKRVAGILIYRLQNTRLRMLHPPSKAARRIRRDVGFII